MAGRHDPPLGGVRQGDGRRAARALPPARPTAAGVLLAIAVLTGTLLSNAGRPSLRASESSRPPDPATLEFRLRFAWGGGTAPRAWHGSLRAEGAEIVALQPLGVEADEAAAVRLVGGEVQLRPLLKRGFDGCDVTLRGAMERTQLHVELRATAAAAPMVLSLPAAEAAAAGRRHKLDDDGAYLVVSRAPGDRLRIVTQRDSLVFSPGETWALEVETDLSPGSMQEPVTLRARLASLGSEAVLWQTEQPATRSAGARVALTVPIPTEEGVYRVVLDATAPEPLPRRLVPFETRQAEVSRSFELAVVDAQRRRPATTSSRTPELTFDPASPSWRQRMPAWAQLPLLKGNGWRPSSETRSAVRPGPEGTALVELPPRGVGTSASWQAYPISVAAPGEPYLLEVAVPAGAAQHLSVCLLEQDEGGRIATTATAAGFYMGDEFSAPGDALVRRRIRLWPQTAAPLLAVANCSAVHPARFGTIALYRDALPVEAGAEEAAVGEAEAAGRRSLAYAAVPALAAACGAPAEYDASGGLRVDGWQTFWTAGRRLVHQMRADGCNAALVSVCDDGGALTPVEGLACSPRYDRRALGAASPDPLRKDVVELWLRLFASERATLIPAINLAAPLPALEQLRETEGESVEWIGSDGRTWSARQGVPKARGPRYNLLHPAVRATLVDRIGALASRYAKHASFGGVALQVSGDGYGALPGLDWGFDDATVRRFDESTGERTPGEGNERFAQRAAHLTGPARAAWRKWRADETTSFYRAVLERLRQERPDAQLVLCFEGLLAAPTIADAVRKAVADGGSFEHAIGEAGIDLQTLAATPGIVVPRPYLAGCEDRLQPRALDLQWNRAPEWDQSLAAVSLAAGMSFHGAETVTLAGFTGREAPPELVWRTCSTPRGDVARRSLAVALAERDPWWLVAGGTSWTAGVDPTVRNFLEVFRRLPACPAEVRGERRQPVVARVYRSGGKTTVALVNPAPWPVRVELPLEYDATVAWERLGQASQLTADVAAAGTLSGTSSTWSAELAPYDLAAWRFDAERLRVAAPQTTVTDLSAAELQRRVEDIESRLRNLDLERELAGLENAGFETLGAGEDIPGWQTRAGLAGRVVLDDAAHEGARAIRLVSTDQVGAGIQSQRFPLPTTGQLLVRSRVRASGLEPQARLYALVEFEGYAGVERRYDVLGDDTPLGDGWTVQELAVNDLPLGAGGAARIQFLLTGKGQVWIDQVQLFDVWFGSRQRVELVKRLYAARAALEDGRSLECLHLVSDYWPRHLAEFVPPRPGLEPVAAVATAAAERPVGQAVAPRDQGEQGAAKRDRWRNLFPRIWR